MRYLWLLVKIALFVALFVAMLGFAVKNAELVSVRYYLGAEWRAPLAFMLLVFFGAGVGLGIIVAALSQILRQRREITALKRELGAKAGKPALGDS